MTWQTFSANGAAYTGYASIDIGAPRLDGQSTPRTGWLKRNGGSYSKTTYAPLWNWALHNGRVVTLGSWAAGAFVFADNGNGTFKLPDNRGEFERVWDDGRGIDSGRNFGSQQSDDIQSHSHTQRYQVLTNRQSGTGDWFAVSGSTTNGAQTGSSGGSETRPRNVALLGTIKF
ncbi:phage tail protein [Rhizobium rhizophilum]|uniref:Tail fiber protein n=1 Tax=Rhizobium rhizophilum TaxID=1850373 RepID=A0ABY2QU35_9HYPH|nr:hypothetical protein [Rhizobium rhizophilum]THV13868.1 hypothetical protein E9677_13285 [Rhizobium rhizophilum]